MTRFILITMVGRFGLKKGQSDPPPKEAAGRPPYRRAGLGSRYGGGATIPVCGDCKTGHRVPAAQPRPTASSPLFSQIASRWFDILPWQPEEANLDLARAIPPPPRARHCTCPPARPSAILEEPPGFRRQDLRRDASEQPRWLISDASEHPRAEPTRLRDFV